MGKKDEQIQAITYKAGPSLPILAESTPSHKSTSNHNNMGVKVTTDEVEKMLEAVTLDKSTVVTIEKQGERGSNLLSKSVKVADKKEDMVKITTKQGENGLKPAPKLDFKSFMNGTLITPNFNPQGVWAQSTEHLRKGTHPSLSANSPAFIPRPPALQNVAAYQQSSPPAVPVGGVYRLQHSPVTPIGGGAYQPQHTPSKPLSGGVSLNAFPTPPATPRTLKFSVEKLQSFIKTIPPPSFNSSEIVPFKLVEPSEYSFLERADPYEKDILISANHIIHNIHRVIKTTSADGGIGYQITDEFNDGKYDVIEALIKMNEEEQQEFWHQNWISISLDFSGEIETEEAEDEDGCKFDKLKKSVVANMLEFGENTGIYKFAKTIFVSISCPPKGVFNHEIRACTKSQQQSPQFREIADVVKELDKYVGIQKLEVIIKVSGKHRSLLTFDQLNWALPFYDCYFENWDLMWQTETMSFPEKLDQWPLSYLDREMHKVHQYRDREWEKRQYRSKRIEAAGAFTAQIDDVNLVIEYRANDARGNTWEHRMQAELEPLRPISYYKHP